MIVVVVVTIKFNRNVFEYHIYKVLLSMCRKQIFKLSDMLKAMCDILNGA